MISAYISSTVIFAAACVAAGTATTSGTPTGTGAPAVHTVSVGEANNQFTPATLYANAGDIVTFEFYPSNHSVIRAQYAYPCIPYEDVVGSAGFFSGFYPLTAVTNNLPTWNLTINDTQPVFYYCGAPNSCIGYGMVGVINPNATESIVTQMSLAMAANYMLEPGQPFPAEASASIVLLASTASISSVPTATVTTSATPSASSAAAASGSSLSSGAIAGIAVGAALGGLLVAAIIFLVWRNKSLAKSLDSNENAHLHPAGSGPPVPPGPPIADGVTRVSVPPAYIQHTSDYKPEEREAVIGVAPNSPQMSYASHYSQHSNFSSPNQGPRYSDASTEPLNGQMPYGRSPQRSPTIHELSAPPNRSLNAFEDHDHDRYE